MLKLYTLTKNGMYLVEPLNALQVQAYKVAGWQVHEYR